MAPGITLNPGRRSAPDRDRRGIADNLLCMSVNPGWGGQSFIPASLERLTALRALCRPGAGVEIDGGVGPATIADCARAGANRFTAGSAIFSAPDPAAAYHDLVERVARRGAARVDLSAGRRGVPRARARARRARRGGRRRRTRWSAACWCATSVVVGEGFHVRPGHRARRGRRARRVPARPPGARPPTSASSPARTHGRTPPCADALVAAGVARVVAAAGDPYREVDGRGFAAPPRCRASTSSCADPTVRIGLARAPPERGLPHARRARPPARHLQGGGDARRPHGDAGRRLALDLVARAAARSCTSWRARRARCWSGAAPRSSDDPELTARDVEPARRAPAAAGRVGPRRAPPSPRRASLQTAALGPVLVLVAPDAPADRRAALEAAGVETLAVASLDDGLRALAGARRDVVLCEGGATLAGALLAGGVLDRVAIFVAPLLLGDAEAPGVLAGLAPAAIADALRAGRLEALPSGPDALPCSTPEPAGAAMSLHPVRRAPGREGPVDARAAEGTTSRRLRVQCRGVHRDRPGGRRGAARRARAPTARG